MNTDALLLEVVERLASLGPERIWRTVRAPGGEILAEGTGWDEDGLPEDMGGVDFAGKSVVDVGCNLGHHCFMAARRGAAQVLGIDMDPEVTACATALAKLHGLPQVRFETADALTGLGGRTFDISMMIDIIGRGIVLKGKAGDFLDAAAALATNEMLHTMRPIYSLNGDLDCPAGFLERLYPERFIRDGRFHLLEFALDRLDADWSATVLTPETDLGHKYKYLVRFTRR